MEYHKTPASLREEAFTKHLRGLSASQLQSGSFEITEKITGDQPSPDAGQIAIARSLGKAEPAAVGKLGAGHLSRDWLGRRVVGNAAGNTSVSLKSARRIRVSFKGTQNMIHAAGLVYCDSKETRGGATGLS